MVAQEQQDSLVAVLRSRLAVCVVSALGFGARLLAPAPRFLSGSAFFAGGAARRQRRVITLVRCRLRAIIFRSGEWRVASGEW